MEKIYISKEEASNKFWGYTVNPDLSVTTQWGRLGLEGQQKTYPFVTNWEVNDYINKKTHEKLRGGYSEVTPEQYEVEAAIAKTIGVDQKVDQLLFVEEKGVTLTPLDATKLHNPDIKPYVYAKLIGKLVDGVHPVKEFIFTPDESFIVTTSKCSTVFAPTQLSTFIKDQRTVVSKTKISGGEDATMAAALEEVVGRVLF